MKKAVSKLFLCAIPWVGIDIRAADIYVESHFIEGTKNYPAVNPGLMKIISKAESGGSPNTLSTLAYPEQAQRLLESFNQTGIVFKVAAYDSKRYIFSIYPTSSQVENVFQRFAQVGIDSYDIGLMQVNSRNAKRNGWDEVRLFNDVVYNIEKSAKLLNDCLNGSASIESSIECYNKGSQKRYSYSYYKRIFAIASNRNK
ncbi:transglycosylase SLT domain-containing protein [Sulfuricurvum sp.]|uniref:transglycosylase SLT domain-containing protein n=1 Tax=Sulfuricurvum sp. TaxID=2025608 RepID=UPI00262F994A|nr:transglycosylase SLT domain-containing protein [Sulfuricurvum sp.]MDD3597917.1 transglycosylase SLT domain-containing protein [Sulfuricurvum sp.]